MADIKPDVEEQVVATDSSPESNEDSEVEVEKPEGEVEAPEEESTPSEEDEKHVDKKGASYRIQELNEKAKAEKARADSLAQQIEKLTASSPTQTDWEQFNQPLPTDENGQVDAAEFEKRILAKATAIAEIQTARNQQITRINSEANQIMDRYKVLNPDAADQYDPDLSESVTEALMAYARQNPTASLTKFADKLMKPYEKAISKQVGGMQEKLTKQAAETALRPNSAPKGEKPFSELSMREMEEKLGIVY